MLTGGGLGFETPFMISTEGWCQCFLGEATTVEEMTYYPIHRIYEI